jgi:hypothetical protein
VQDAALLAFRGIQSFWCRQCSSVVSDHCEKHGL